MKKQKQLEKDLTHWREPRAPCINELNIPPFVAPNDGVKRKPKELRQLEIDHIAYTRAMSEQENAQKLYAEVVEMKKPIADSSTATSQQIDQNIQTTSDARKMVRNENRSRWQEMSDLEVVGCKATILHQTISQE
jgi:hypothetical protein